ncbi:hypothetical protein EB001_14180 [bacterium]|jgi:hypothetical protein|nr:hypothetical protein [bacterium]
MRKDYKVYGDKVHKYYVTINADSADIAWDAAQAMTTDMWQAVPTDDVIDPYHVEEMDNN